MNCKQGCINIYTDFNRSWACRGGILIFFLLSCLFAGAGIYGMIDTKDYTIYSFLATAGICGILFTLMVGCIYIIGFCRTCEMPTPQSLV